MVRINPSFSYADKSVKSLANTKSVEKAAAAELKENALNLVGQSVEGLKDLEKHANFTGQSVKGLKNLEKIGKKSLFSKAATAIKQAASNVSQTFKNIIK